MLATSSMSPYAEFESKQKYARFDRSRILSVVQEREIVSCTLQGTCLQIGFSYHAKVKSIPPLRAGITTFSAKSRRRILEFCNKIDYEKCGRCSLITLTYPDTQIHVEYKERTQDRYLFLRKLETHLGRMVPTLWRCEWKSRRSGRYKGYAVPHVHYLAFGVPWVDWKFIRQAWRGVLHHDGPLSTDIRESKNKKQTLLYVGKYIAKVCSLDNVPYINNASLVGKAWDITRQKLIPLHPPIRFLDLPKAKVDELRWLVGQAIPKYDTKLGGSVTIFGEKWIEAAAVILSEGLDVANDEV